MKKIFLIFASVFVMTFFGCSKADVKNENGWFTNYDACLKQAKSSGKNILLVISRDEDDGVSKDLKTNVLYTDDFKSKFSEKYEFCETDISSSLFMKAKPPKDATEEQKKDSKKYEKILDEKMRVVTIHGITNTPSLFILSKEGYVIYDFAYIPCKTVSDFETLLNDYSEEISSYEKMIQDVRNAKGKEKVFAIDTMYERTKTNFRYMMTDLMKQVEKLDKKNETGLVGKYVMAIATSDAMDAFMARKPEQVEQIYAKSAEHKALTNEQRQQSYYATAYIIGSNTPTPELTQRIIEYLEKAIAIDPNSEIGKHCSTLLSQVKDFKIRQDEAESRNKAEASPEAEQE